MKVLVFSDTHDHIDRVQQMIDQANGIVEAAIFCGDLAAPFTAAQLAQLGVPVHAVFGNCDLDQGYIIERSMGAIAWQPIGKEFQEVTLGGRAIAFNHYPRLAELQAKSGEYDAVFHGHTHQARIDHVGETLLCNPGAVCGIQQGKYGTASYALYDTESNTVEIVELE